jgi:hypothetical protein
MEVRIMARRSNRQNTEAGTAEVQTENTEDTVSTSTNEAPATETTNEAPAPESAPVDLSAFEAAVSAAVDEADVTTGEVPEASLSTVTIEYRKLEGLKAKNAAKKLVADGMKEAMNDNSLPKARAYLSLQEKALVAASGSTGGSTPRQPADPTEAFVQRIATLNLASAAAQANVPDGVAEDWGVRVGNLVTESSEAVSGYVKWLTSDDENKGDEPEVSVVVKAAAKLSLGKSAKAGGARITSSGTPYTGERRDIAKHIVEAFGDQEVGTFMRVSEIRKFHSSEYGDDLPSAGAISVRLFPKSGDSTMPKLGIQPDVRDGKKGAVKLAEPTE